MKTKLNYCYVMGLYCERGSEGFIYTHILATVTLFCTTEMTYSILDFAFFTEKLVNFKTFLIGGDKGSNVLLKKMQ